jgi:biopolymer transport protein ExbD
MVFYKLFLERENMHQIKRYYLLAALAFSIAIPLITFIQYVEPTITESFVQSTETYISYIEVEGVPTPINYTPLILWSLYGLGVLIFGLKFSLNLFEIFKKIKRNPKFKNKNFINVLLTDLITPHTFFSYIFLNKDKYEAQEIPQEVFIHEQTHATQKHSVDVLFIELLQVVFWFNPLLYFIKKDIKLNHEFLADQAVLKNGIQPSAYQTLLLTFSSNIAEPKLANAINYSSIRLKIFGKEITLFNSFGQVKKRFTVMKTHTSKQKIWLRSFLLLPLVAVTLYGFSKRQEVVKDLSSEVFNNDTIQDVNIYINENEELFLNKIPVTIENLPEEINKLNKNLTKEQKNIFLFPTIEYENEKSESIIKKIQAILFKLNFSSFSTSNVSNLKKMGLPSGMPKNKYAGKTVEEAESIYNNVVIDLSPKVKDANSPWQISAEVNEVSYEEIDDSNIRAKSVSSEMIAEYNTIVEDINSKPIDKKIIKLKNLDRIRIIYSQMSDEQRQSALPFPEFYGNPSMDAVTPKATNQVSPWQIGVEINKVTIDNTEVTKQSKAKPEEVAEYNKLAKHCNSQLESEHPFIKSKDISRTAELFLKMSIEQKNKAESYPDFSKLPPPPSPETGFIKVSGETLWYVKLNPTKYYNTKGVLVDKNGNTLNGNNQVNASDVLPGQYVTKVYQNNKVVVEFKDNMPKQQKATQEEIAEYNKLAKQFNSQDPNKSIIKQKDAERMTLLYNKMTKEQKANAEPLPKMVPPPPPPVPANASQEKKEQYVTAHEAYNKKYRVENGKMSENPSPLVPAQKQQNPPTQKEIGAYNAWAKKIHSESTTISDNATLLPIVDEQNLIKFSDIYNRMSLLQKNESIEFPFPGLNVKENKHNFQLPPPAPPAPKSPLDHVIEMAKKGALFYSEGKLISSDKAINLLKKNDELNLTIKQADSKQPKVYITRDPIVIKE